MDGRDERLENGWHDALCVAGATLAFAALHSALASDRAKALAARLVGERARDGWYRAFYNAQAFVTTAALLAYGRRRPGRTVWHVRGPLALALRAGQAAGLALAVGGLRQVGVWRFAGGPAVVAWSTGQPRIPREPEGQGPRIEPDGRVPAPGSFAWTRHPLNVALLPICWLEPRMTTTWLAFSAIATAYVVAGSWHEEARLVARYGGAYEAYRRAVRFFGGLPTEPRDGFGRDDV